MAVRARSTLDRQVTVKPGEEDAKSSEKPYFASLHGTFREFWSATSGQPTGRIELSGHLVDAIWQEQFLFRNCIQFLLVCLVNAIWCRPNLRDRAAMH